MTTQCCIQGERFLKTNTYIASTDACNKMITPNIYDTYKQMLRKDSGKTIVFVSDDKISGECVLYHDLFLLSLPSNSYITCQSYIYELLHGYHQIFIHPVCRSYIYQTSSLLHDTLFPGFPIFSIFYKVRLVLVQQVVHLQLRKIF